MPTVDHIESLRAKHAMLEQQIDLENQRPHPDDIRLLELKRQKLHIKDEIVRLEHA
jgi:hypothetical protein